MLTVGSLFSGAGLCDLGLQWAGFRHQWFCEIDPFCREVLARHWPGVPIYGDIRALKGGELPPVDVLCGGFPCQDVSSGGFRAGINDGTRSGLWLEYARLIGEMRPKYVIIENVRGLLSLGIDIVLGDLAGIGYDAEWEILPAAALGAPHHRERVFIVAYPHRPELHAERIFSPLEGIVGKVFRSRVLSDWLGIRFDRARKDAAVQAYGEPVLYRVDDGRTGGLDKSGRPFPSSAHVIAPEAAKAWLPRLKALGNAITPQQAYAVGACILTAAGYQPGERPDLLFRAARRPGRSDL